MRGSDGGRREKESGVGRREKGSDGGRREKGCDGRPVGRICVWGFLFYARKRARKFSRPHPLCLTTPTKLTAPKL